MRHGNPPVRLRNLDSHQSKLRQAPVIPHTVSAADIGREMVRLCLYASISCTMGLGDVGSVIRAKRLALLGHVARLDHAVPAWKALDVALRAKGGAVPFPGWHRPRGHPRRTWVDHVKEDVAVPLDSVMLLAADRQACTSLRYDPSLTRRV